MSRRALKPRRLRWRGVVLASVMAALVVLWPAAAQGAPKWVASQKLADAGLVGDFGSVFGSRHYLAFSGQGDAIVAIDNGSVVSRPAGGDWNAPENLCPPCQSNQAPQVAMDAQGDAVAVWAQVENGSSSHYGIEAAVRPKGGNWSLSAQPLSAPSAQGTRPDVAVDRQGDAVAAWTWSDGNSFFIQAATRPANASPSDPWDGPQDLSAAIPIPTSTGSLIPEVAVGPKGDAVVIWTECQGITQPPGTCRVQAATRRAGASRTDARRGWSSPHELTSESGTSLAPPSNSPAHAAVDSEGNAVVVWLHYSLSPDSVQAATFDSAGSSCPGQAPCWSGAHTLSAPGVDGANASEPEVGVDPQGNAVAIWSTFANDPTTPLGVQAATRPAKGDWGQAQTLSVSPHGGEFPVVRFSAQGDAVAVWVRFENSPEPGSGSNDPTGVSHAILQAVTRPANGAWSAPQDITPTKEVTAEHTPALLGVDDQGNAIVAWTECNWHTRCTPEYPRAMGYDAAGPQLRDLSVPETGAVGSVLSASVSPVDVWSGVASTTWDFGDGVSASGVSVSHAYTAAGSYTVSVTSTDTLGNASTARRTVVVAGPGGASVLAGVSSATGALSSAVKKLPAVVGAVAEAARASRFHSCLAQAARKARGKRNALQNRSARRRCLLLYGRTPGRVTGLRARALSSSRIELSFAAPGSDGNHPPAAHSYLIRQSLRMVRGAHRFAGAQTLCGGSCRVSVVLVGARVRLTITGLSSHRSYSYTVAARDNVSGRLGPRSQTVSATTR